MAANNICVICLPNYNVGKNSLPDAEARNSANLAHMQTMTQIPICKSAGQQAIASLPITTNHYFSEHQSYAISMLTMILRLEVCQEVLAATTNDHNFQQPPLPQNNHNKIAHNLMHCRRSNAKCLHRNLQAALYNHCTLFGAHQQSQMVLHSHYRYSTN